MFSFNDVTMVSCPSKCYFYWLCRGHERTNKKGTEKKMCLIQGPHIIW